VCSASFAKNIKPAQVPWKCIGECSKLDVLVIGRLTKQSIHRKNLRQIQPSEHVTTGSLRQAEAVTIVRCANHARHTHTGLRLLTHALKGSIMPVRSAINAIVVLSPPDVKYITLLMHMAREKEITSNIV
jgi:hypothetical protein